jgi:lysophospholipase L1-like esterase
MRPTSRRRSVRGLGADVALGAASLVVFFALAEGGARLLGARPEPGLNPLFSWTGERGDVWRFEPGARWTTRVGGHPVVANAQGFRDRDFAPKPPGVFRILVLGDSVTFGHGQPLDSIFTRRLESRLADRSPRIEVLNAGIPGWSTHQQRRFYESDGAALDPDLVLVAFVLNDVTEIQRGRIELRLETGMALVRAINWLAERSAAVAAVKRTYAAVFAPQDREVRSVAELVLREDAPEVEHAMQLAQAELERLHRLAAARGDVLGLVLFPFRFQFAASGERELDAPQRRLRGFAEERGLPVLDTLPALRQHAVDDVLMDADHLTALGHRVSAEAIADWLEREALLPPPEGAAPAPSGPGGSGPSA